MGLKNSARCDKYMRGATFTPPTMPFEISDEARKAFEGYLAMEFNDFTRPQFRDDREKDTAIRCWWITEIQRRHAVEKINDFRLALGRLTG